MIPSVPPVSVVIVLSVARITGPVNVTLGSLPSPAASETVISPFKVIDVPAVTARVLISDVPLVPIAATETVPVPLA